MYAIILSKKLDKFGVHYGWVMAVLAFLTTVFSSASFSMPHVLILPITAEFNWKISDVTTPISLMFLTLATMAPFGSALMLRFGVARVVATTGVFIAIGLICTTQIFLKWHLLISIGVFLGIAAGMIGLGLTATVATRWFSARRGLVVGILTAGFAAGQLTFVPLAAWLAANYDWRLAVLPALIGSGICAISFLLFGKDWPSQLGLPPFGETKIKEPPPPTKESPIHISFSFLKEAIKVPVFWMLTVTFFICGLSSTGIVGQHFIPFCSDNNIGTVVAASYLALMGVFNFLGTVGSGWLSDRFNNYNLLAVYYGLRGASLIWLPYSDFDVFSLTLWAIFFGLDFIATVPPTVRLAGQFFGPVKGPVLFGWIFSSHQIGSAFAAFAAGETRDSVLTYLPAFVTAGISCFIAVLFVIAFRRYRPIVA